MTMIFQEAVDQLRAAGLRVRVFPVSHNGYSTEAMSVVYHDEAAVLADPISALSEPTFWIDWQRDIWTLVSSFAIPMSPVIRISSDLASLTQAIQDFYALCFQSVSGNDRHRAVCTTMLHLQSMGFVVEIYDADSLHVRVPLVLEKIDLQKNIKMLEAPRLRYRQEESFIRLHEAQWQLEHWRNSEKQSITLLANLEEAVQMLAQFYGHPKETEAPPRRSVPHPPTDPLS